MSLTRLVMRLMAARALMDRTLATVSTELALPNAWRAASNRAAERPARMTVAPKL